MARATSSSSHLHTYVRIMSSKISHAHRICYYYLGIIITSSRYINAMDLDRYGTVCHLLRIVYVCVVHGCMQLQATAQGFLAASGANRAKGNHEFDFGADQVLKYQCEIRSL